MLSLIRLSSTFWRCPPFAVPSRTFSSEDRICKLVRDKIPSIIEKSGKRCDFIVCRGGAYKGAYEHALQNKLFEEVEELSRAGTDEEWLEELVDVQEVVLSLLRAKGYQLQDLEEARARKYAEKGGFQQGFILIQFSNK